MVRPVGLFDEVSIARTISGLIAAENASLIDANYPVASAFSCRGFDTIFVGVEITAGTAPTATIEALFRDADAADGLRWHRRLFGTRPGVTAIAAPAVQDTGALATNGDFVELYVHGAPLVYLRVKAVTNPTSTTACKILIQPGQRRPK